jgi:pimeloyl-ACP methyl ester carboxylesterase
MDYSATALRFADAHLSTGVRLRYAVYGDPAGPPVILLHGYSDSWFSFSRVLPLLPARYHVVALDQRGHGDADRPARGYTIRDLAADVLACMDVLALTRATVVGHSMGSFVAQQVAHAAPERVAGLVLIGSATTPRQIVGIHELQQAVDALTDPVPTAFVREFQTSTVAQPLPADFMERVVADSHKLPARVWRAVMAGMLATDRLTGLGDRPLPTLICWGERDTYCPRAEQAALVAQLPDAVFKVYPETGHALHWERPGQFVRDLADFLTPTALRHAGPEPVPMAGGLLGA